MFSERLRELRKNKKAKQNEVALALGIATSTYSMYEQGQREPDLETTRKISEYFNVSTDYLLDNEHLEQARKEIYDLFTKINDPDKKKAALEVLKSLSKE